GGAARVRRVQQSGPVLALGSQPDGRRSQVRAVRAGKLARRAASAFQGASLRSRAHGVRCRGRIMRACEPSAGSTKMRFPKLTQAQIDALPKVLDLLDIVPSEPTGAPAVFQSPRFAMKGGTALNLLVQDMPRLRRHR